MLSANGVTKSYGSKVVLKNIDLKLAANQTHVILGTSGCGKSTLLRTFLGLTPYQAGRVTFDEFPVTHESRQQIAEKVGYVVQEGGLFPHLTARRNVTLMARLRKWESARLQSRVSELALLVDLPETLLDRFPQQLSGGQRQRVSLMRALMLNPEYLMLDEPLGALDPITRSDLQSELKQIFSRLEKTVVMVTHDLSEAAFFGNTVTLMHEGVIVQHGTFEELIRTPANEYVSTFIRAQRPSPFLKELSDG